MNLTRDEMEAEKEFHRLATAWCLKRHREARHWTQEQMAEKAHVSRGGVQHAEHARHGLTDPTRIAICLALDITEVELVAEVARVKGEWAVHGLPPDVEMPKTLAVIYAAFCGAFEAIKPPPPCPSVTTPALFFAWMKAADSTLGRR